METALQIAISAVDNTKAAFDAVSRNIGAVEDNLKSVRSRLKDNEEAFRGLATAGGVAFGAISAAVYGSVKAYGDAERAQRQLAHAVVDVSKGTDDQVQAILDVADALQKKVGIDGDALTMGAAQLSTFGLQSKSVIALTKSLADLTVNQSGVTAGANEYVGSANTIAKALNGQFGILEKSGIRFTEAQKQMIQFGKETDKVKALQEGLAQNLRETTDTLGGVDVMQARVSASMGEVAETIGQIFAPILDDLATKLVPIIEKIQEWATNNPGLIEQIVKVGLAISGLLLVMGTLGLILPSIITGFLFLASPIGIVAAALAGAVAAFVIFQDEITAWAEQSGVLDAIRFLWDGLKLAWEAIAAVWTESLKPALLELWNALAPLQPLLEVIGAVIGGALIGAILALAFAFSAIAQGISFAISIITGLINIIVGGLMPIFTYLKTVLVGLFQIWTGGIQGVDTVWEKVWASIKLVTKAGVNLVVDLVNGMINFVLGGINKIIRAINSVSRMGARVGVSIPSIPEIDTSNYNIPKFAEGGIVTKPLVGMIGEAGAEAVIPLSKWDNTVGKGTGDTIVNITVNGDVSGRDLIDTVKRAIMNDLKHNVRLT